MIPRFLSNKLSSKQRKGLAAVAQEVELWNFILASQVHIPEKKIDFFFLSFLKIAQAGGRTWDLLVFRLFSLASNATDNWATLRQAFS